MSFALSAPVSYPLLLTVVGWVICLFCGFGLMSKVSPMPVITLAVGAIAIASAVQAHLKVFVDGGVISKYGIPERSYSWKGSPRPASARSTRRSSGNSTATCSLTYKVGSFMPSR